MKSRNDNAGGENPARRTALTGLLAAILAIHGLADIFIIFAARREMLEGLPPPTVFEYVLTGFEASAKLLVSALMWEFSPFSYFMATGYFIYAVISGTVSVLVLPPRLPMLLWGAGTLYYALFLQAVDSRPVRESLLGMGASSPKAVVTAKWAFLAAALLGLAWHVLSGTL